MVLSHYKIKPAANNVYMFIAFPTPQGRYPSLNFYTKIISLRCKTNDEK